jgi:nucleotide-binding universal stress UspA family protein
MYKKILVPLDGSDLAEGSLEHVKAIATGCHVPEVVLFAVVEPIPQPGDMGLMGGYWGIQAEQEALDWFKEYLMKLSDKLSSAGIQVKTAIARGRAADEILDYVKKNGVDLIIMTTHGRSGVARWVMGSVADKVVRYAAVPVLIISPQGAKSSK